jgi:hypothetical protein
LRINTGLVFWGVALITAGAVALAIQAGAIDGAAARELWRFWPVALIVIGVSVIAARTPLALLTTALAGLVVGGLGGTLVSGFPEGISFGCEGEPAESVSQEGSFGSTGEVVLDLDCGTLDVAMAPGAGWTLDARHAPDAAPGVEAGNGSLHVESEGAAVFGFTEARQSWEVGLPTEPTLDLEVEANAATSALALEEGTFSRLAIDANAGEVTLGLAGASVDELQIDANAGSLSVSVDEGTALAGAVSMNAGSLELCAAEGVNLAITIADANVTFSHNLEDSGLTLDGDTWRSGAGAAAVSLDIEGNAASFTLNPEEGCS